METPTRPTVAIAFAAAVLTVTVTAVLTAAQTSSVPQSAPAAQLPAAAQSPDAQLATIKQYCVSCHNDRTKVGGVSFEGATADSIGQRAEAQLWK